MENLESRLRNAPCFRCEKGSDSVPVCQKCETCILACKIFSAKEWFHRVSEMSQRRFLVSILEQLDSLYLLHYFQNILQTTQGKDFIYNRSRINLSKKEGKSLKPSLNQILDKTVEQKTEEILPWFGKSPNGTKAHFTLLLLQMCDSNLLLAAADVIRALLLREQKHISGEPGHREQPEGPQRPGRQISGVCEGAGGVDELRQVGIFQRQDRVLCPDTQSCLPKEKLFNRTSF